MERQLKRVNKIYGFDSYKLWSVNGSEAINGSLLCSNYKNGKQRGYCFDGNLENILSDGTGYQPNSLCVRLLFLILTVL